MNIFEKRPVSISLTLRALAYLLRYPDSSFRAHGQELIEAVKAESALSPSRTQELVNLIHRLSKRPSLEVESEYVDIFDRGRRTSLLMFEHVHGDSRDRGPAMVDLIQTYERAGLLLGPDELPDYLPVILEFASTQPAQQAQEFLSELTHIARAIFTALHERQSDYASVLAAMIELSGEKAEPVVIHAEQALDESWAEPEVFGGCSTEGQNKPGQPQPIRIVKRTATETTLHQQGA